MKRLINLLILQILTFVSFSQTRTTSGDAIRKEITPKYVNGVIKQLTIAQLKAQPISNGDSTTLYYVTDTGKKGYFELDKNDNSSVGNDSTIIVTNNGKRLKRTIEQYLLPSTTGKYYRGDKTWQVIAKSDIPTLSNVDNTSDLNKPISTATQTALLGKIDKGYSISELRGLSNSVLAATQIFYCSETGKEGFWKYDASDNSSTDNLGTILVTGGGKRLKRVFERGIVFADWFGCDNTGTVESTNNLQSAINFCSSFSSHVDSNVPYILKLSKGKYKIGNVILMSGVSISGNGRNSTKILAVSDSGYVFRTTKFTFGTMSYETSISDLSINGNPSYNFTDTNFSSRPNCSGIGVFSNAGMYIKNVSIYNLAGNGIGFFTGQDISVHNIDVLNCGIGLNFGRYGGDVANAIHFTACRIEKNDKNMNIGDNLDQVRDINFSACKFEEGLIEIKSCTGIMFSACSFVCSIIGNYTIKIIAGSPVDTRCVDFTGCFFTTPYVGQTKAIQANGIGTNPIVVSSCTITGLDKYAFDGDIVFENNSLYDIKAPYISISNKGSANNNKAYAITYTDETIDFYGAVKNKESNTRISVLDVSANVNIADNILSGNKVYKNYLSYEIVVTGYIKVLTNDSTSYLFTTRIGNSSSSLLDGHVFSIQSNLYTLNSIIPITLKVKPGQYFQFYSTNESSVKLVGATIN